MALHLVQAGSGASRDIVVAYHVAPSVAGPALAAVSPPEACIAIEIRDGFSSVYQRNHGLPSLPETLAAIQALAGETFEPRLLFVIGFSAGCQALREHLNEGNFPSGMIALDGVHASDPPDQASQIHSWEVYCGLARDEHVLCRITHTQIDVSGYLPTKVVSPMVAGVEDAPEEQESEPLPHTTQNIGWMWLDSYDGKVGADHNAQQQVVMAPALAGFFEVARGNEEALAPVLSGDALPPDNGSQTPVPASSGSSSNPSGSGAISGSSSAAGHADPTDESPANGSFWSRHKTAIVGTVATGSVLVAGLLTYRYWRKTYPQPDILVRERNIP